MKVPLEISFRGVEKTHDMENLIREKAAKLEQICSYLSSCSVAVESPQEHQESGNPFQVRIYMRVPPGHELVVRRESGRGDMHDELPKVLRDAFQASLRQLRELTERQRGEVKTHPEQETTAVVVKLGVNRVTEKPEEGSASEGTIPITASLSLNIYTYSVPSD